ncbi:sugar nucleotide-binding protein [Butyrivibrio fibrisolvens]|uniref:sugar nucleotide-binding protein n=1 Tax=Pseudobutyrivibrio ruminis TaxID=46206 RepID=UPI000425BE73|nr:sugar nucleotide-binding protein [Pseudobutyrivibrio ruminis]MDC7280173.1 sugar nucleotide-binding protein [Butyrivibrio fibrisolvens]
MKVLVIGTSGFLGKTVYHLLKEAGNDVIGTYNSKPVDGMQQLDVLDVESLISILESSQPDAIIWTVMNHNLEEEIADKVMPKLCQHIGAARLIFLSTSVALEEKMSEDVTPLIRTSDMYNYHYFNGKIKSEKVIQNLENYCIVRPGSIYGINPYGEMDVRSKALKEHLDSGEEYVRADNIIFSIVEVNELAAAIVELISSDYVGVLNISEEQPVSHYEFNKALCSLHGWDDSCIVPNQEKECIYYLDNSRRKQVLESEILGKLKHSHYPKEK